MASGKEKLNIKALGILLVLISLAAFFFGSGRGILSKSSYEVWGLPMVVLGAVIVIVSYILPTNEGIGKRGTKRKLFTIRRILIILALILFGFISYLVAYYVFHIEIPL